MYIFQKFLHFSARSNSKRRFHSSVNSVIYHHIDNLAPQIHDRAQFIFELFIGMIHLENSLCLARCIQNISPVGRNNIISCCPDQRDILYDHLPAHVKSRCQFLPRDRNHTAADCIYNLFPSLCPCHSTSLLYQITLHCMQILHFHFNLSDKRRIFPRHLHCLFHTSGSSDMIIFQEDSI